MPPAASTSNARGGSSVSVAATKVTGPAISKINKGTRGQMQMIQAKEKAAEVTLTARERLRLHLQRNLATQESAARQANAQAQALPQANPRPAAATHPQNTQPAGQKVPAKNAKRVPSAASTPPPSLVQNKLPVLQGLYALHEDTR